MEAIRRMKKGNVLGQWTKVACLNWNNQFSKVKGSSPMVMRQRSPMGKQVIQNLCWA